jgi:hypothetical protein
MDLDLLWIALGICVVVGLVFFVMANSWRRVLVFHSGTIRQLSQRVQALEEIEDPAFRRKIGDSSPSPLEQVFTFTLRLSDTFWKEALRAAPAEMEYVRAHGSFLGSVKIERWRSHAVVTIHEVLPQSKAAGWQIRSLDVYPAGRDAGWGSLALWELPLASAAAEPPEAPPTLELRLEGNGLILRARNGRFLSAHANGSVSAEDGIVFLRVPLNPEQLASYRRADDDDPASHGDSPRDDAAWVECYAYADEGQGLEWQLRVRDLLGKSDWERWKTMDVWQARGAAAEN